MKIKIKELKEGFTPTYTRKGDACLDCRAAIADEFIKIPSHSRCLIPLGFALALPEGYEAVIRPRSGLSKDGIDVAIGTVDSNYRGEIKANIINNSEGPFEIRRSEKICQLAIRKTEEIEFEKVSELDETERGINGFGSSGK